MTSIRWLCLTALAAAALTGACDDSSSFSAGGGSGGTAGTGGGILADAGSISGLALINPACAVGDGGTVSQLCTDCSYEHCAAETEQCFGVTWETSLLGGICGSFGECVAACDCGDSDCFKQCLDALDALTDDPCRACIVAIASCQQTHCATECERDEPDAGHGGHGSG